MVDNIVSAFKGVSYVILCYACLSNVSIKLCNKVVDVCAVVVYSVLFNKLCELLSEVVNRNYIR